MRKLTLLISIICSAGLSLYSQNLENFGLSTTEGLLIKTLVTEGDSNGIQLESPIPVFSFELNGRYHVSNDVNSGLAGTRFIMNYENSLSVTFTSFGGGHPGWRGEITFENEGFDTIEIANVLPFGEIICFKSHFFAQIFSLSNSGFPAQSI